MKLTAADFTTVLKDLGATGGTCLPAADLALGATDALAMLGANRTATACWLATLTQESDAFKTTEEYAKDGPYAPYIGRTFEQVTWWANYLAFGEWAAGEGLITDPKLFVNHPTRLRDTRWAWLGGVWFFKAHTGLWQDGCAGDFQRVSVVVNGGSPFPRGWTARLHAYRAWSSRVARLPPLAVDGQRGPETLTRLQQWVGVRMTGAWDLGTVHGIQQWLGRPLATALSKDDTKALQAAIGAYVDGDWGAGTTKDLQTYLNREA